MKECVQEASKLGQLVKSKRKIIVEMNKQQDLNQRQIEEMRQVIQ